MYPKVEVSDYLKTRLLKLKTSKKSIQNKEERMINAVVPFLNEVFEPIDDKVSLLVDRPLISYEIQCIVNFIVVPMDFHFLVNRPLLIVMVSNSNNTLDVG